MEKKKFQSVSIAALIVSILPLAALAPSLLHLSLSDGVRTAWAGANIVFVQYVYYDVVKLVQKCKSKELACLVSQRQSFVHYINVDTQQLIHARVHTTLIENSLELFLELAVVDACEKGVGRRL